MKIIFQLVTRIVGTTEEDGTLNITGVDSGLYAISVETEGVVTFEVDGEEVTGESSVNVQLLSETIAVNVIISETESEEEDEV